MMPVVNGVMLAVSSSPAAAIAAKATIILALAIIGVRLARGSRAAMRHALLAAAFGALLVLPIASLVAPPVRVAVTAAMQRPIAADSPAADSDETLPIGRANGGVQHMTALARSSWLSLYAMLTMGWIAGAALSLLPMVLGLRQVRLMRRSGVRWGQGRRVAEALARDAGVRRPIEVQLHTAAPGPMTCGILCPAIVLPTDARAWKAEDLDRAMVHEMEHVRRGDWLSHCLARAVCAVYWFHPLVWMAWRRLALEAERSCDDAVVGRSEATAYADQLVGLARRLSVAAKSPLLAMANRADLATRVGAVLDQRQRRGRAGVFPLALICMAAAALVVTISSLRVVAAQQSAATKPAFDVVSVKLVDPDSHGEHSHEDSDLGRISMSGTMHRFIIRAYGITDGQLGSEPDWFKTRIYSIDAVTSSPAHESQMMLMLRAALADRFQLKLRQENRDLPVYVLEVAPGGPKFKELKPGEVPSDRGAPPGVFARTFTSVEDLMNSLNRVFGGRLSVDRPVVNRTGLGGRYDMRLETEVETQVDDDGNRRSMFPNLFHDMQSELGLKLVATKVGMPYFVVEHAAMPTAN